MRIFAIFLLIIGLTFFINIFEDLKLFEAQKNLKNQNLEGSLEQFKKIKNPKDEDFYNIAKIYQKLENYDEAINNYNKIKKFEMQFQKLFELGNSYEKLHNYQEAIMYYKSALNYKDDPETKNRLERLTKKIKSNANEETDDFSREMLEEKLGSSQEDLNDDEGKDNGKENKNPLKSSTANKNNNESDISNLGRNERSKNEREKIKMKQLGNFNYKRLKDNTLDNDDKQWIKKLNEREIQTLLIPLDFDGEKYEQNKNKPW